MGKTDDERDEAAAQDAAIAAAESQHSLEEDPQEVASAQSGPSSESSGGSAAQSTGSSQRQPVVVHHTKYREDAVYRIVHHQASIAREVQENGRTHIEWSQCPVCFGHHDAAFNERIVASVRQIFCTACNERHESDYDETVYR